MFDYDCGYPEYSTAETYPVGFFSSVEYEDRGEYICTNFCVDTSAPYESWN